VLVTRDEVPDPQALRIECSIDGERLQDSSTSQMVFGIRKLVAELSAIMTLEPGDLVATEPRPASERRGTRGGGYGRASASAFRSSGWACWKIPP